MGWLKQLACDRCEEEARCFEVVSEMKMNACIMSSKHSIVDITKLYDYCDLLETILFLM